MSGWGASLAAHLPDGDVVINFAKGGATTRSFVMEGLWEALIKELSPGDIVLIQFGHNDQKLPEDLAAEGGYGHNLESFISEVRDGGGIPVLCTSVERRLFEGASLRHSHGAYPAAVRRVAAGRDVPLIDLTVFTAWYYEHLGADESGRLFTDRDNTHFHVRGAGLVASFVARSLRALNGSDDALEPLGKYQ